MLKLKLQYFGYDMKSQLIGKDPYAGKDWRQKEKGTAEDETIRQCHQFNGHEFEQRLEYSEGQGGLDSWGHKESDTTTEQQQQQIAD